MTTSDESTGRLSVGRYARDRRTGLVGRVMGHVGPYTQLRPVRGGCEWDAEPADLEELGGSDELSAKVAEKNRESAVGLALKYPRPD
ncbi:hypothetical protein [Streptomyces sp. SID11385]|uniref:hypothetical protein n=1 Tax=Streptomyces sp. SID11385 TaxID=2706031 RepID=UPI0013CCCD9B|nr:hypothetical protein [Streptomyces sp. SID11385]